MKRAEKREKTAKKGKVKFALCRILTIGAVTSGALACGIFAAGCEKQTAENTAAEILFAPTNLTIESEILRWEEVENAVGYTVKIDGTEYRTKNAELDIFDITDHWGNYEIYVRADGESEGKTSVWSDKIEYKVSIPQLTYEKLSSGAGCAVSVKTELSGKVVIPAAADDGTPVVAVARNGFYRYCEEVTGIVLPESVREIGKSAFLTCKALRRIGGTENVEKIGGNAFGGSGIEKIELSDRLTYIGASAFASCKKLTELYIPKNVSEIGIPLFDDRSAVRKLSVSEENATYRSEKNCIIKKQGEALVEGTLATTIPLTVRQIDTGAFARNDIMEDVTVPGNVKVVQAGAFSSDLKTIVFAEGVEEIYPTEEGVSSVYNPPSGFIKPLQRIAFPSTARVIGNGIVSRTENAEIAVNEWNEVYKVAGGCILQKSNNEVISGSGGDSVIPSGAVSIGEYAFSYCSLTEITIPEGVTEIKEGAFSVSAYLSYVKLPQSLRVIGKRAFYSCVKLNVCIPEAVEEIKEEAFKCTPDEMTNSRVYVSIVLPSSVKTIGTEAFYGQGVTVYTDDTYDAITAKYKHWRRGSRFCSCVLKKESGDLYVENFTLVYQFDILGQNDKRTVIGWGESTAPYRHGYEFVGWSIEDNLTEEIFLKKNQEEKDSGYYTMQNLYEYKVSWKSYVDGTIFYAIWKKI